MSTIDHAAEAYKLVDRAMYPPTDINRAQVHATLALVEQQRIANLIALTHVEAHEGPYDEGAMLASEALHALIEYERTPATPFSDPDDVPVIRADIREGLGLS